MSAIDPPSSVSNSLIATGTTFSVDAVTPAEKAIWTESLADSLGRRFKRKIFVLQEPAKPVINNVIDFLKQSTRAGIDLSRFGSQCHPLIDAIHVAFSQHRPLSLSPDAIWLVIAQGFGHHVAENAEKLRHRLVRHKGRQQLTATVEICLSPDSSQPLQIFPGKSGTQPTLCYTKLWFALFRLQRWQFVSPVK
jgi:Domain of unknown function (DUF4419)